MKQSLRSKLWLAALLLILPFVGRADNVEAGKVYQIVNDQYGLALTSNGPDGGINCTTPAEGKYAQLWIAEAGATRYSYYFRNLATNKYLLSSNAQSTQWRLSADKTSNADLRLYTKEIGSKTVYTIRPADQDWGRAYMHCDGSKNVVCWDASAATSQWLFTEVEVSQDEIDGATSKTEEVNTIVTNADKYAEILGRIFADGACTRLAGTPSEADLAALPAVLRNMVSKVQSGDWSEVNNNNADIKWDSQHALRFRARDYNVFSRGWEITGLTGHQAQTNMNNPTGIMGNAYDVLFIMVDEEPKDDATIYFSMFSHNLMQNSWNDGVQLHKGLNVVPVWSDNATGWIYYTAKTWEGDGDRNGHPAHKLSEFPPIKIHIEGGVINSYWDSQIDTEDDWFYYRDRAQHTMYDILGKYSHIRYFLDRHGWGAADKPNHDGLRQVLSRYEKDITQNCDGRSILRAVKTHDIVYLGENLAMGTMSDEEIKEYGRGFSNNWDTWEIWQNTEGESYYNTLADDDIVKWNFRDYYNNRHMSIEAQDVSNPNGGQWRSCQPAGNQSGMMDVVNCDIWTLYHEAGHTFQAPINLVGQTETSNNGLANIATLFGTSRTTRSHYVDVNARQFNNGVVFQVGELWSCVKMYYQLWLYYHGAGYNKSFFPRLYELQRREPYTHHPVWEPVPTRQIEDGLLFAKHACIAAGEDLTEFFEGWGFLFPCDNLYVGDYTSHYLSVTQAEIDKWRAEIKALNLPKNVTPLFIDERPGDTLRWNYPEQRFHKENAGDLGGLVHFKARTRVTKPYSYTLSGNDVTMEDGEGGIGFIVRDKEGRMLGYSNRLNFPVNAATASKLLAGEASIYALGEGRDTEPSLCASTMATATPAKRAELIRNLAEKAAPYTDNIDDEGIIVGKYKVGQVGRLRELRNEALAILEKAEEAKYEDIFNRLSTEFYNVDGQTNNLIAFIPGSTYHLTMRGDDGSYKYALAMNRAGKITRALVDAGNTRQQWVFEPMDGDHFALKNVGIGKYIGYETDGTNNSKVLGYKASTEPQSFSRGNISNFLFCLYGNNHWNSSMVWNDRQNGFIPDNTEKWGNGQFLLTLVDADPLGLGRQVIDDLIAETTELFEKAGNVDDTPRPIPVPLGREDEYYFSNSKCKSTEFGDQFTSFDVLNDTTTTTFFHSDYSGEDSDDGLDHYIGVDLAGGNPETNKMTVSKFHVIYSTRGSGWCVNPSRILIQASQDGNEWFDIQEITEDLPTGNNEEYVSDVLTSPKPARFVRMMVLDNTTGQQAGGHKYFIVSEFSIANANLTASVAPEYPNVTADLLISVNDALKSAVKVRAKSSDVDAIHVATGNLRDRYYALAAAMGVPTGIESVTPDDASGLTGARGIYDLQGRRLKSADAPGLYIIDGRKVLVK